VTFLIICIGEHSFSLSSIDIRAFKLTVGLCIREVRRHLKTRRLQLVCIHSTYRSCSATDINWFWRNLCKSMIIQFNCRSGSCYYYWKTPACAALESAPRSRHAQNNPKI